MLDHARVYYSRVKSGCQQKTKKKVAKVEEIDILLEEVDKQKCFLFGQYSEFVINESKKAQLQSVTRAVTEWSYTERTGDEVGLSQTRIPLSKRLQ